MAKKKRSKGATRFTKAQILASETIPYSKDLLNAILIDEEQYEIKEVKKLVENYLKGKVK